MYIEFKEGQKHANVIADQSPMHEGFKDAGWVLTNDDLIVDIDDKPREMLEKMIQTFGIKTQIVYTDRGIHMYFKKPKAFKGTRSVCPLGFEVEYKHIQNTKAITIKRGGKLRDIVNAGVREELPDFLYIRTKLDDLFGLDDGDGRNQKLYAHKFKIMSVGNWKRVLRFINENVFASPMKEDEIDTVAREEQIRAEKDAEYDVAMALKNKLKIKKFNANLYVYDGFRYVTDTIKNEAFTIAVAKHLAGQKSRYIEEVVKQLHLFPELVEEPSYGFDVKFKNGILRNGKWHEIDSQDFTPFYLNLEYNEDAEHVQAVDDYLDFLTDGDAEYRQLILECMGHTLITNPEMKRQLAKFFVFIGDGGNGKGTMLEVLRKILGRQNCSSLSPEEMTKEQYFTSLQGKLANCGDDIEDKAINEKQMKALKNISTCDYVSSRQLYQQSTEVVVTTSLIFTSNHLLKSFEKGESYKRRVVWMPMFGKVTKKDPQIITKLTSDKAKGYWVRLMVEAYFRLHENAGFTESQKVAKYNHSYHEENNGTLMFVRDHKPEDFEGLRPPEVYDMYEIWATENGITVQSKKILNETLDIELGIKAISTKVGGKSARVYRSSNLKTA
jgi:putative DNA primase/helicase